MQVTTKRRRSRLTPEERERRKHQRSADRKNAKLATEHPLFVDQLKAEGAFTDAEKEYWRWRVNISEGVERLAFICSPARRGLKWVELQQIERFAATVIPPSDLADMKAYWRRTFNCDPTKGYGFWCDVLTGYPVVFAWKRVPVDNPLGFKVEPDEFWPPADWTAPLTKQQFYERFPYADSVPPPHDDGGLSELLDRISVVNGRKAVT